MTFKVGDKVRVTPEYAAWYRELSRGVPPQITPEIDLVIVNIRHGEACVEEWGVTPPKVSKVAYMPVGYLMSAEPDPATAVIEAARAVLKHVSIAIVTRAQQNYLEVSAWAGTTHCLQWYEESADEFPDTFLGNIAMLRGAVEAYDESEGEDE